LHLIFFIFVLHITKQFVFKKIQKGYENLKKGLMLLAFGWVMYKLVSFQSGKI
jgi:hypothetical protein